MLLRYQLDVPVGSDHAHVLVEIDSSPAASGARNPVNLALVLDRSSSMRGPRMTQAVAAATQVVGRLDSRDRLTIVAFDSSARVLFGPAPVSDANRASICDTLRQIDTGVGTNLAAGMRKGADAVRRVFVRDAVSRMVLLTDGQASVGVTRADRLCEIAEAHYHSGVPMTAMGIGEGFEDDLLAEMAARGRGGFYYLASPESIPAAFGRELAGVFAIAATELKLRLVPARTTTSIELLHRLPSSAAEDGLVVDVGEVAADTPRRVLFRLGRDTANPSSHLGTLTCTHNTPAGTSGDPQLLGIEVPAHPEPAASRAVTTERMRIQVATAVDVAWARRASGDAGDALLRLRAIRAELESRCREYSLDDATVADLFEDIRCAEAAINKNAEDREKIRRSLKERSEVTLLGRSGVRPVRNSD